MNENLLNRRAYYRGSNRSWYMNGDTEYEIIEVRQDGKAVMLDNGEWVGVAKIELVPFKATDIDEVFANAAGGKYAMLDAEIARLEARLIELKAARKVLDSL